MITGSAREGGCYTMRLRQSRLLAGCALILLSLLLGTRPASAQGSVTPSFGDGKLVLVGEGYRSGERVEITVHAAGASHSFTVAADARGRFRLDTALVVPPLSSVEIEARDEQGLTQATTTSAPGGPSRPSGGNLPPTGPTPSSPLPTQLPRTGATANPALTGGALAVMLFLAGLAVLGRNRSTGRRRPHQPRKKESSDKVSR